MEGISMEGISISAEYGEIDPEKTCAACPYIKEVKSGHVCGNPKSEKNHWCISPDYGWCDTKLGIVRAKKGPTAESYTSPEPYDDFD